MYNAVDVADTIIGLKENNRGNSRPNKNATGTNSQVLKQK
jgi:hypothetical protein